MSKFPSLSDIKRAHQRISQYITHTPILRSQSIDDMAGANIYFKCENFQKTGSFKMRGATNAVFSIRPEERVNGFATHSSGNHAAALAYAAKLAGVKAYIVMPNNAPIIKKKAVEGYGGEIIYCKPTEKDRIETCNQILEKTGAIFIPPFEHPDIIAGQATAAKELMEETQDLDIVMTPVGGGGLAAGTALAVNYIMPTKRVILGEPLNANDTYLSFQKGEITPIRNPDTIADGLKTTVGTLNFEIIKKHVAQVITVSEDEIISAMRHVWERMKIIIEPSCAVPFAAVLKNPEIFKDQKIGIILTGGNVDLGHLPFD